MVTATLHRNLAPSPLSHSYELTVPLQTAQNSLTTIFVCLPPLNIVTFCKNVRLSASPTFWLGNCDETRACSRCRLAAGWVKINDRKGLQSESSSLRWALPPISFISALARRGLNSLMTAAGGMRVDGRSVRAFGPVRSMKVVWELC